MTDNVSYPSYGPTAINTTIPLRGGASEDVYMAEPALRPLQAPDEIAACARIMAGSDPWKTLGRQYDACYQIIADPAREVIVADADGTVAGFLVLNMQGAFTGYIQSVAVAEAYRGLGLGTRLIRAAEERIFRASPNVFMCVSSFNPAAHRLYERLGYQVVGELADYIVRGHAEILLRKTIGPLAEFIPTAQPPAPGAGS